MMRKWTKILPFFIIEWFVMKMNPHLEYVKIGRIPERLSYVYAIYPEMVFIRDSEAIKREQLKKLKEKVANLEYELKGEELKE